jgi:hypothetical protein
MWMSVLVFLRTSSDLLRLSAPDKMEGDNSPSPGHQRLLHIQNYRTAAGLQDYQPPITSQKFKKASEDAFERSLLIKQSEDHHDIAGTTAA